MINSVKLNNFRGFKDISIPLSQVTMLTGINGIGKTTVLESLFCLFSETRLDVSYLARYYRTTGGFISQFNAMPNIATRPYFNYKLFWDECAMSNEKPCVVSAKSSDGTTWIWFYLKGKTANLGANLIRDAGLMGIPMDPTTDVAYFNWQHIGTLVDKNNQRIDIDEKSNKAQILNPDNALYLVPPESQLSGLCRFLDFVSIRAMPIELSYKTAQRLTEALKIFNPQITDIRISRIENGLSVILDNSRETTLGSIGNGAVAWLSTLIAIYELIDHFKIDQQTNIPVFILVDEIGAGIHYSLMHDIWKYIHYLTQTFPQIQFVVTSHNDDCIMAFCEVFEVFNEEKDSASIVRLHRPADSEVIPTVYDISQFENIKSGEWEVRG